MIYNNPYTTYTDDVGRPFRVMGMKRMPNSEKWTDGCLKCHWGVLIKYLDEKKPDKKVLLYDHLDRQYEK